MKGFKKFSVLFLIILLGVGFLFSCTAFFVSAADAEFEKQIEAFPESYKIGLRKLHEEYPEWRFEPFNTGLDWKTVIDNEHDDHALVYNPDAARIFKSLDEDDYDAVNDRFYYKDGSFVAASRTAVEYFMDPRNFLDKGGIFQFEVLSFSSMYTVAMVESVLEGSFMGNAKMIYVDASGKKYTDSKTYAQAIFEAGKTHNINPCFLASKILNEVGSNGSDSVSGTNSSYPGIYNFYNIGATDGSGAIERGLLWASGGSSGSTYYYRPWTTPYKSIMGGALFLAEEYIAAGQFTGYLQRFNVNPDADYNLYSHQYMSNLTGALSQGYSTYASYRDMNMLSESLTFSIPVFKNMSDENGNGKLAGAESTEQYGQVSASYCNVRTGPSIDHNKSTDSKGNTLYLEKGDEVKILGKYETDAYYYEEILSWPYWYKVSFTSSGKSYTGYIPGDYIDITTAVYVAPGVTDIAFVKSDTVNNKIAVSNPLIAKVIDNNTVQFLKKGNVKVYLYDSSGLIEEILFKVGNYASYYSSNLRVSSDENTISASIDSHETAVSYGFSVGDTKGNLKKASFSSQRDFNLGSLKSGTPYIIFAQNCYGKNAYTKAVPAVAITKPQKIEKLDFSKTASGTAVLSWQTVENATGYQVLSFDETTEKYMSELVVPFGQNSCTLTVAQAAKENYVVRAYTKHESTVAYGSPSNMISLSDKPVMPDSVKVSSVTANGYLISFKGDQKSDGYQIYVCVEGENSYTLLKETTETSIKITGLVSGDIRSYRIRAFRNTPSGRMYSSATSPITGITLPEIPKNLSVKSESYSASVTWSAVKGATSYNLLYRKAGGDLKTLIVNGTSAQLNGLDHYSTYYFAVSATVTNGTQSVTGSRSSTLTVKTKPKVPDNFRVTERGYDYIDVAWDKSAELDGYRVYVLDSSGRLLGSKVSYGNSLRLSSLSPVSKYSLIIRGYKLVDGKYVASENSKALEATTLVPSPVNIKSTGITEKSFRITWDKIQAAKYYGVYMLEGNGYIRVATVSTNFCDVDFLKPSSVGRFYLTASFEKNGEIIESKPSVVFTASTLPAKITGISAKATSNSVFLSWNEIKDAYCYRVYLYENGKYVLKATVSENNVTLENLKDCTSNKVAVRAYFKNTTGVATGNYTELKFNTLPLSITKIVQSNKTDTSYTLSWNASSAAVNRYFVYRYNEEKGGFECLGSTANTSCNLKGITPGTTQRYAVIACVVKDGKTVISSKYTYYFDCGTYLSKTENFRVLSSGTNSLRLAWDPVEGATAYNMYYYDTESKVFRLLGTTQSTVATLKNLPSGKEYIFRVNATKQTENEIIQGYYSEVLYATTK